MSWNIEGVVIGADHGGVDLKEKIRGSYSDLPIEDVGTFNHEPVDYPLIAKKVCSFLKKKQNYIGVLLCRSGVGMAIAANRISGVRAVCAGDLETVVMARHHNNVNVLCLGADHITTDKAIELIKAMIETDFDGGRHERRIDQLDTLNE